MATISYHPTLAVWCRNLGPVLHSVYPSSFKLLTPYFEHSKALPMLISVLNFTAIALRESKLCLVQLRSIAYSGLGTSLHISQMCTLVPGSEPYTVHIYEKTLNVRDIELQFCILIALGTPHKIHNFQLDSISENKMAAVS